MSGHTRASLYLDHVRARARSLSPSVDHGIDCFVRLLSSSKDDSVFFARVRSSPIATRRENDLLNGSRTPHFIEYKTIVLRARTTPSALENIRRIIIFRKRGFCDERSREKQKLDGHYTACRHRALITARE